MASRSTLKLSEHQIQVQIMDWLKAKRIFHWRANTGAFAGEYKGKKRFVRFGTPGSPDIFVVDHGRLIGIEVKRPGEKLSDKQVEFLEGLAAAGASYVLACRLVDVVDFILGSRISSDKYGFPPSGQAAANAKAPKPTRSSEMKTANGFAQEILERKFNGASLREFNECVGLIEARDAEIRQACAAEYQPQLDEATRERDAATKALDAFLEKAKGLEAIIDEARKQVTGCECPICKGLLAVLDRSGARGGSGAGQSEPSPDNPPTNEDRSRT